MRLIRTNLKIILLTLLVILYHFLTIYNASKIIEPQEYYIKFYDKDNILYILSLLITLIPILYFGSKKNLKNPAWIFYIFIYMNFSTVGFMIVDNFYEYLFIVLFLASSGVFFIIGYSLNLPINIKKSKAIRIDYVIGLIIVLIGFYIMYSNNFSLNLNFDSIYSRRLLFRDEVGYIGYLIGFYKLVLPLIAIYALSYCKNKYWIILLFFIIIVNFSLDGSKTVIFLPFFMLVIIFALKKNILPYILLSLIIFLSIISIIENIIFGSSFAAIYIIRRIVVAPAFIANYYWNFQGGDINLSNITFDIGSYFLNNENNNVNSNFLMYPLLWGSYMASFFVSFIGGLVISLLKVWPGRQYPDFGSLAGCTILYLWSEQFFHTSLLSGGVFWLLLLCFLMHRYPGSFSSIRPIRSC